MNIYDQFLSPENFHNPKIECHAPNEIFGKEIINTLQNGVE